MASNFLDGAQQRASMGAIDAPLAALVAIAVAFVAYAMPVDLLTRLVEMSQLPSVLAAAEPPLGFKARLLVSLAGAVLSFIAVFALLRALGRNGSPGAEPAVEIAEETPRLRRADFHPDAPARRPILAGRDFGEPEAAVEPLPVPEREPEPEPEPQDEPIAEEPVLELGEALEPEEIAMPADMPSFQRAPEPAEEQSISELIARLERGLAGRLRAKGVYPPSNAPSTAAFEDEGDDRLRSAIANLQRMASRAG